MSEQYRIQIFHFCWSENHETKISGSVYNPSQRDFWERERESRDFFEKKLLNIYFSEWVMSSSSNKQDTVRFFFSIKKKKNVVGRRRLSLSLSLRHFNETFI